MNIEYIHASKYGNGAAIAEQFSKQMAAAGATVNIHHVKQVDPKKLPPADLYFFSSPGRFGKPIGEMQRALKKLQLAEGTKYVIVATELNPLADSDEGQQAESDEPGQCQRVLPTMNEILQEKGLREIAAEKIFVTGMKGPLEKGWEKKVEALAVRVAECD